VALSSSPQVVERDGMMLSKVVDPIDRPRATIRNTPARPRTRPNGDYCLSYRPSARCDDPYNQMSHIGFRRVTAAQGWEKKRQ
jgi:hypothetical protein